MSSCRIGKADEARFVKIAHGISRKADVFGKATLLCEFKLDKGAVIPAHKHPHEQIGFLVSGKMLFTIDEQEYLMNRGDSWCITGNIEHKAEALEDSFVIEVFSPVREEFITQD